MRCPLLPLFLAPLLIAHAAHAQQPDDRPARTLLGGERPMHHGGWAAPEAAYTRMLDQDVMLVGLRAGWIIDHRFTIGLAGKGAVTDILNADYDLQLVEAGHVIRKPSRFRMGYGGLLLEPVIAYRSPVHISLPILIGAGGGGYETFMPPVQDLEHQYHWDDAQAFFVVEPGIDLEISMIRFVRIGLGVSYRYTTDLDLPATAKDALHGINAGLSLKLGRF
ncbi:MAG: hypothetical protein IPJ87_04645 [Flavobacteriales bacterium]|nr:hypothetical protein [Flavobacteriales bacterium]MBK7941152.1 hypothetical protein [Flavobacteriales bacterium]MBK9701178.1 hypothetical protein [Flavobacteriales bacterium]